MTEIDKKVSPLVKTNVVLTTLEETLLLPLKKLIEIFTFLVNWAKVIGSTETQFSLINSSKLPKKSQINMLIKPCLYLLEKPLLNYLSSFSSKSLFMLNLVYEKEKKHPNSMVVKSLLKRCAFQGPSASKICHFFPTPESDSLQFGEGCCMNACFLKNKSKTLGLKQLKHKIKKMQVSTRSIIPHLFLTSRRKKHQRTSFKFILLVRIYKLHHSQFQEHFLNKHCKCVGVVSPIIR